MYHWIPIKQLMLQFLRWILFAVEFASFGDKMAQPLRKQVTVSKQNTLWHFLASLTRLSASAVVLAGTNPRHVSQKSSSSRSKSNLLLELGCEMPVQAECFATALPCHNVPCTQIRTEMPAHFRERLFFSLIDLLHALNSILRILLHSPSVQ